jgi:predicted methyltransferase
MRRMTAHHTLARRPFLFTLAALGALPACSTTAMNAGMAPEDEALKAALALPHRSAGNRARDTHRHPYETLRFLGLRPTLTVLELTPGGGWYTEVLAPYLRPQGQFAVAHFAKEGGSEGMRRARSNFEARVAKQPELYDRMRIGTLPVEGRFPDLGEDGSFDLVLTFRNVHNWLEDKSLDSKLLACQRLLKTGGVLGVVDHRASPGTAIETQMKTGYVTEALMEERARAAGFTLAARSEVNANPRDTKDHVNGVWSLPPTFAGKEVDRERLAAIGESDRFTHRYVKAGA